MPVMMDRYTRYYANQSGGGKIGPVYRARFTVQRDDVTGSFRGLFRFDKPLLYSGSKAVGIET
jgi:hypothetical protein